MSAQVLPEYQPLIPTKLCPDCKDPNAVFGRDRSQRDGLHQRCKKCNREKMQAIRNRKYALRDVGILPTPKPEPIALSPVDLILKGLESGRPVERRELKIATGMGWDDFGDALALLIGKDVESWTMEVKFGNENDFTRWYRLSAQ